MTDAHVTVREELLGCVGCGIRENQGTVAVIDLLVSRRRIMRMISSRPEKVAVKYY